MRKLTVFFFVAVLAITFTSCGYNVANVINANTNSTDVELSSNNFKVVDRVAGSSDVTYILGIGGMSAQQLHDNAYSDMVKKANLTGNSRALANVLTEWHLGGFFPIFYTLTVSVSANVVEFTK